eukprot:1188347-Prorocentrum_minimum.AAC.1
MPPPLTRVSFLGPPGGRVRAPLRGLQGAQVPAAPVDQAPLALQQPGTGQGAPAAAGVPRRRGTPRCQRAPAGGPDGAPAGHLPARGHLPPLRRVHPPQCAPVPSTLTPIPSTPTPVPSALTPVPSTPTPVPSYVVICLFIWAPPRRPLVNKRKITREAKHNARPPLDPLGFLDITAAGNRRLFAKSCRTLPLRTAHPTPRGVFGTYSDDAEGNGVGQLAVLASGNVVFLLYAWGIGAYNEPTKQLLGNIDILCEAGVYLVAFLQAAGLTGDVAAAGYSMLGFQVGPRGGPEGG